MSSNDMLKHVATEYPCLTVSQRCDRCCALIIIEECYLSKANRRLGWFLIGIGFNCFNEIDFRLKLRIFWFCVFDIDRDFAGPIAEHVILVAYITVANYNLTSLELLLLHSIR